MNVSFHFIFCIKIINCTQFVHIDNFFVDLSTGALFSLPEPKAHKVSL